MKGLLLAAVLLAGCASAGGPAGTTSVVPSPGPRGTVTGVVTLGPVCPVERVPPDPTCAPRPLAADIDVTGATAAPPVRSAADGRFRIELPPGTYVVQARSPASRGCKPETVMVAAGLEVKVDLSCDTGIR